MSPKEATLEALINLVDKIDAVQTEIDCLFPLMDFGDEFQVGDQQKEIEKEIAEYIERFSSVYKSNRDKFVSKMVSRIELMK